MEISKLNRKGYKVHYFFGRSSTLPFFVKIVCTPSGIIRHVKTGQATIKPKNSLTKVKAQFKKFVSQKIENVFEKLNEMGYSHSPDIPPEVYGNLYYFSHKNLKNVSGNRPAYFSVLVIDQCVEYSSNSNILRKWRHHLLQDLKDHFIQLKYEFFSIR